MAIATTASESAPVVDEPARPTLFAPGGPLSTANDPHPTPEAGTPEPAVAHALAPDLFSTHTREPNEDPAEVGPQPPIDLRDGATHGATDATPASDVHDASPGTPQLDATMFDTELLETMATAAEAIEYVERARGHLYTLHHLLVRADILFTEVAASLHEQGRTDEAELLESRVIGRGMVDGRWSFEVVEAFDDSFYGPVSGAVRDLERRTVGGHRHARESVLKATRAATESAHHHD